jgi:4-methylaminobutanoate oxidase (formaldehyde-forming)
LRVTFVGELGWELHIPQEYATRVYEALLETGSQHGIANAGYRAINSLRLEKGYRVWGADLTPDHTPLEAGLGWATKLKTNVPFLGREALEKQQQQQLTKSLATFTADPDVVLLGRETIYRDQQQVGWLTSGGYGYTVEKSIGYGYVRRAEGLDRDWLLAGSYELEVAGERVPAAIHCQPLYDPKMERIKC